MEILSNSGLQQKAENTKLQIEKIEDKLSYKNEDQSKTSQLTGSTDQKN